MIDKQVDILIVGGGLIGGSLLLALEHSGYTTLLVEAQPFKDDVQADLDGRSLALSPATVRILNMLKVWPLLEDHATPIETIHVSEQRRFGLTRLQGQKEKPLGYVVEMQYINRALHQLINKKNIIAPAQLTALDEASGLATINTTQGEHGIQAKLIVAADGGQSSVRRLTAMATETKDYQQTAIVANIKLSKPHLNQAFERFSTKGPLALLPLSDQRMSLVWAMPPLEAEQRLNLSDSQFLSSLQEAFGYRLGRFLQTGQRFSFPLQQLIMPRQVKWPVVFVGNAAHTLHPVAGQGFNLGIRDVTMLAQMIIQNGLNQEMLKTYQDLRQGDQSLVIRMTDGLLSLFGSRLPGLKLARTLGMIGLDNAPFLKKIVSHYASGFGGVVSDLICEIPLHTSTKETS